MTRRIQNNASEQGVTPRRSGFQPGKSGNPGGRPRVVVEVRALLAQNTVKAAQALVDLLDSDDDKTRAAAANSILDRVLGKAAQSVNVSGGEGVNVALAAIMLSRQQVPPTPAPAELEAGEDEGA